MKKPLHKLLPAVMGLFAFLTGMVNVKSMYGQELIIGSGTLTSSSLPIYSCFGYNYSQQIYLADELNDALVAEGYTAGTALFIEKVAFKLPASVLATTNFKDWVVYLGNTSKSSFSSTSDWVAIGELSEVFDGIIPSPLIPNEWMELVLDVPFLWDGVSNIVVAVDENTPSWNCTQSWMAFASGSTRAIYYYSDGTNPNPTAPPTASSSTSTISQIKFNGVEATSCSDGELLAGVLADYSVCPSVSFAVSNSSYTMADGLERIWQTRVAGTTEWTTIVGATSSSYFNSTGITENTEYRSIVTCLETGESDTTNIATVSLGEFYECYCTPSFTSMCSYSPYIGSVVTTGALGNISNTSTCSGSNYEDFTSTPALQVLPSSPFDITITNPTSWSTGMKVWIDLNHNGIFESTEIVTSSTSTVFTHTGTVILPATTPPGLTGMRVGIVQSTTTFGPCDDTHYYGEMEDYMVNIIPLDPCTSIEAGALSSVDSICPSTAFVVTNIEATIAAGVETIWQQSTDGGTTWTTIAGATDYNLMVTAGITEATSYRKIMTCIEVGESDTSDIITVEISNFMDCYCIPTYTYGCSGGSRIGSFSTNLAITNISNLGTGCSPSTGYANYTATHELSVMQLMTISQTTVVESWGGGVKIWIDYNQNGIFGDIPEELVASSTSTVSAGSSFTSTFEIPITAIPGYTVMRVRVVESSSTFDPCSSGYYGETEDYLVNIVPAVSCSDPSIIFPASVSSIASPEHVCGTGDVSLNIGAPMPLSSGITYQWQTAPTAAGPWTYVGTPSLTSPYYLEGISSNTFVRCVIKCEDEVQMYSNVIEVESVVPEAPVLESGQTCGPGTVTLNGTVGTGSIFWFEDEVGGMPFATGTSVETPSLTSTTTFYAAAGAFPPAQAEIGASLSGTSYWDPGPFNQYYRRYTMQMMYTKDQLEAAGAMAGPFDAVSFYLNAAVSVPFPDYTVSIKTIPAASASSLTWQTTGLTQVFGGTGTIYTPEEIGWQTLNFDAPMTWDGNSHIIVQICWSQNTGFAWASGGTNRYTSTPGQFLFSGSNDAGNSCGLTATNSSNYLPNAIFNFPGCISERVPVEAHVREVPTIEIGVDDGEYCLFNNTFTIPTTPAQPAGTTFEWSTGGTDTFISVSTEGVPTTYWVEVTNEWGCIDRDSVNLTLKPSPVVDLGPDTLVCEGGTLTLDAGDGGSIYYWNTGESTRYITVDDGGNYTVLVTNSFGCMGTDTIGVTMEGFAPSIDGIIVNNISPNTFQFSPYLPMHVIGYSWDFGDDTEGSVSVNPTHTYAEPGTYMVTLTVSSTCGKMEYYTYASIVQSVEDYELSQNNLKLYPNPAVQKLNIETLGGIKMNKLKVINVLGQEILTLDMNNIDKYTLDVQNLPAGSYYIQIESEKGTLLKKFQIAK